MNNGGCEGLAGFCLCQKCLFPLFAGSITSACTMDCDDLHDPIMQAASLHRTLLSTA